jgi:hypothetical protein
VQLTDFEMMPTEMPKGVQAVLQFGEDYELSIVSNDVSYGGSKGLYEIMVLKNGQQSELPGVTNQGDSIKGFLSEAEVDGILKKMYLITGKQPVQI